jgi:hypothetical protein
MYCLQQMQNQNPGNNNNSRQGGRGNPNNNPNNNFNNNMNQSQQQFPIDTTDLNNLPPAQQQAIIAAQLSFAMAAAAQQGMGNNGMLFDNGQQLMNDGSNFNQNSNNQGGGRINDRINTDKGSLRLDNRPNNNNVNNPGGNNNNRRQFDRRGGKSGHGGNRDDSYGPGFDNKRIRY